MAGGVTRDLGRLMNHSTLQRFFRLTIKDLLALSALVALAVVIMRHPATAWWWLSSLAMPLVLAASVVAVVGSGPTSHWSRGFVVCLFIYGGMVLLSPGNEMAPSGWLPTTRWLAEFEPTSWSVTSLVEPSFPESQFTVDLSAVNRPTHYRVGHLVIALGLGIAGGRLARCVGGGAQMAPIK